MERPRGAEHKAGSLATFWGLSEWRLMASSDSFCCVLFLFRLFGPAINAMTRWSFRRDLCTAVTEVSRAAPTDARPWEARAAVTTRRRGRAAATDDARAPRPEQCAHRGGAVTSPCGSSTF